MPSSDLVAHPAAVGGRCVVRERTVLKRSATFEGMYSATISIGGVFCKCTASKRWAAAGVVPHPTAILSSVALKCATGKCGAAGVITHSTAVVSSVVRESAVCDREVADRVSDVSGMGVGVVVRLVIETNTSAILV